MGVWTGIWGLGLGFGGYFDILGGYFDMKVGYLDMKVGYLGGNGLGLVVIDLDWWL